MDEAQQAKWDEGLAVMDQVYGQGFSEMMKGQEFAPMTRDVVSYQFLEMWADPTLSIRDKRLLVMGATAMLGRADLIEIQVGGAIANEELTEAQLMQIPRLMLTYAGAGNATMVHRGIMNALANAKAKKTATLP
jgi:4-carboxymuconolactone decarboxylase